MYLQISLLRWAASTIASPSRRSISVLPSSVWRRAYLTTATPTSPVRLSYGQVGGFDLGGKPSGYYTTAESIVEKMKKGDKVIDYYAEPINARASL